MVETGPSRRLSWPAIARDTANGTFEHGFTHAGNLAYLSLVTLFPFVILLAAIAGQLGRTADGLAAVNGFLTALPSNVAALIAPALTDVIAADSSSGVITFSLAVALWTSSGVLVTLRTIVTQAYGRESEMPYLRWRLLGLLEVLGLVLLLLFLALWGLFALLCPRRFRIAPVWPGALATAAAWTATTLALPRALTLFGGYALTYGSLAGVIIALLYFYIIGLGMVLGAQLNAAIARARLEIAAIPR